MEMTIKCKWCGKKIPYQKDVIELLTELDLDNYEEECSGCWELRHRIEMNPDLARRILAQITEKEAR